MDKNKNNDNDSDASISDPTPSSSNESEDSNDSDNDSDNALNDKTKSNAARTNTPAPQLNVTPVSMISHDDNITNDVTVDDIAETEAETEAEIGAGDDDNTNDNLVTISWKHAFYVKTSLVFNLGVLIYLTYSYAVMPSALRSDITSILMLTYIIMGWFRPLIQFANVVCIFRNLGRTMHRNRWAAHLPENRFPWNWGKLFTVPMISIGIYFCINFTHASPVDTCNVYSGMTHPCVASMIIMILTYIAFGFIAITLLLMCCCAPCLLCILCSGIRDGNTVTMNERAVGGNGNRTVATQGNSIIQNPTQAAMVEFISSYLPISHEPPNDHLCAICYMEDAQLNNNWRTLPCDHKFHPGCIDPWITDRNNCPLCRRVVNDHITSV